MESKGRHLVYVSKASINLLISRLRDEGWHVDATTCARDVRIAAQRKIVSLGFIDYSTLPRNRDIDSLMNLYPFQIFAGHPQRPPNS
ncbi:hypothetical protein [Burkholderia pseudomallei]|uniref:hypothetical protein n=1 Tax=Burkholderia pseudomallei TaxID=28450 RepID=UPI0011C4BD77|nr:hypothetical protein [Burkholderia pseudomallei]